MMDYKNDERYWNIKLLNKWFAISSILFLFSIVWMFIHDNDDEFKVYQREFRKLEAQVASDKLEDELEKVISERNIYENKYDSELLKYNQQTQLSDSLNNILEIEKGSLYKKNMDYLFYKAEVDVIKYEYEKDLSHHMHGSHSDENLHYDNEEDHNHHSDSNYKKEYNDALLKLNDLKIIKEEAELIISAIESELKLLKSDLKKADDNLNKYLKNVNLLEKQVKSLDRSKMTLLNQLGDIVRDLPIIDFMDPYYKVHQIVATDVKYDVNFASVPAVDRCTSCHLGIDNADFEDAPQPFTTHPRLDLYITSSSPHSMDQFGCTSCHAGRARGTTFNSSSHTPGSLEQKKEWEEKYDWEKIHHWLQPMLPTKYTQASCFTCHESQPIVDGGDKLALGLGLISKSGCNNCHHIESYPKENNAGPPLTHLDKKLSKEWVAKWIEDPQAFRYNTWMPHFFHQDNNSDEESIKRNHMEIYAMTEYLFENGEKKMNNSSKFIGDSVNGEKLFSAVGCMGCHQVDQNPQDVTFDNLPYELYASEYGYDETEMSRYELLKNQGPNLIGMGSKSDAEWIYNWIKNPSEYYPGTRMPDLRLTHEESADITAYLLTLKNKDFENDSPPVYDSEEMINIARRWLVKSFPESEADMKLNAMTNSDLLQYVGKKSINYYGCYTCHEIKGFEDGKPIGVELTQEGSKPLNKLEFAHIHSIEHANYAWFEQKLANPRIFDRGKVVPPEDKSRMPNFYFTPTEIEAITTAILGFNSNKYSDKMLIENLVDDKNVFKGYSLLQRYNCQGCHIIDDFGGQIVDVIGSAEYSPPNLNTQGVKTQPDWLFNFFKNPITIRPNLQVRMPSFTMLNDDDWNAIITAFQDMENHNLSFESHAKIDPSSTEFKAGIKLHELGACNNCHFYGEVFPVQTASTWAPNLAMTKDRLRHDWVIEWLRDPQYIMPGTKMPAPYLPTNDLLEGPDAIETWGVDLVRLGGDNDAMLKGLTDYLYSIDGKTDISKIVKDYFKANGYDFNSSDEEEDEDDWDDEW